MKNINSIFLIVGISGAVGILHFIIGPGYNGIFKNFMSGYLIDLVLPMNVYLLFQIALRKRYSVKTSRIAGAITTYAIGLIVEISQFFEHDFLGSTFDPWDLLMYGLGCGLGILIDIFIIERLESQSFKEIHQ
jgi:hypothetical protein